MTDINYEAANEALTKFDAWIRVNEGNHAGMYPFGSVTAARAIVDAALENMGTLYRLDETQTDGLMGAIDNAGLFTGDERASLFDCIREFLIPVYPKETK